MFLMCFLRVSILCARLRSQFLSGNCETNDNTRNQSEQDSIAPWLAMREFVRTQPETKHLVVTEWINLAPKNNNSRRATVNVRTPVTLHPILLARTLAPFVANQASHSPRWSNKCFCASSSKPTKLSSLRCPIMESLLCYQSQKHL